MKKIFRKQTIILVSALLAVLFILPASAEQTVWDCPQCGRQGNSGNYCGGCAHPAPWTETPPADEAPSGPVIYELGDIASLNIEDRTSAAVYHFTYQTTAEAKPTNGSGQGYMYVNSDSPNYGIQIVYSNTGVFTRQLNGGSYAEWVNTSAPPAPSGPVVIELGKISSLDIEERERGAVYHFTCDDAETGSPTSGSGQGYLFVNTDSVNYGRMFFISNRGIYSRNLSDGRYGNWKTVVN